MLIDWGLLAPALSVEHHPAYHAIPTVHQIIATPLLPLKAALEEHLFGRFRHLCAPHCDLVFYDLTSTYLEGLGPEELAQHGYSRDQRPRNPQLLAMVDGLPVSHTVFAGNRRDSTTVREVLADLRKRFGLGRFVFVGDRGMKSEASVAALEEQGLGPPMIHQPRHSGAGRGAFLDSFATAGKSCRQRA